MALCTASDARLSLGAWIPGVRPDLGEVQDLKPCTREALASTPPLGESDIISVLEVSTDGTGGKGRQPPAWGAVLLGRLADDSLRVVGYTGGPVLVGRFTPGWVGALHPDSLAAEFMGLIWGVWTALKFVEELRDAGRPAPTCLFRFDNKCAGGVAFSTWECSREPVLSRVAAGLARLLAARTLVRAEHVPGHEGDPWNEAADAVCTTLSTRPGVLEVELPDALAAALKQLMRHDGLPLSWVHLYYACGSVMDQYPWGADGALGTGSVPAACQVQCVPAPAIWPQLDEYLEADAPVSGDGAVLPRPFRWCTFNCLSLRTLAARETLERGLRQHRIGIACLQETRSKETGIKSAVGPYLRVASAGTAKNYGCEVWVSSGSAFADHGDISVKVRPQDIVVLYAEPRGLLIRIHNSAMDVCVASLHAPTKADMAEYRSFWQSWAPRLAAQQALGPVLCGVDANCEPPGGGTGPFRGLGVAGPTPGAPFFREALEEAHLYVADTDASLVRVGAP